MKINLNQIIKNFDGTPGKITNSSTGAEEKYTVLIALKDAALANVPNLSNEEKMSRWVIAKKIRKAKDTLELTMEEAVKLKGWVTSNTPTLVAGQIADLLEGLEEEKEEKK